MPRLVFTDSPGDMVVKLCGGDNDAKQALIECVKALQGRRELGYDYIAMLILIDEHEIYDGDLGLVWTACRRDVATFSRLLQCIQWSDQFASLVKQSIREYKQPGALQPAIIANMMNHLMLPGPATDERAD